MTYRFVAQDYGQAPAKPTVGMEPPYENLPTRSGRRIDSHQVRQGAYWATLAGAAGHGYGALDLGHLYKDNDGPFPRHGFQRWRQALAYEGRHLKVGVFADNNFASNCASGSYG